MSYDRHMPWDDNVFGGLLHTDQKTIKTKCEQRVKCDDDHIVSQDERVECADCAREMAEMMDTFLSIPQYGFESKESRENWEERALELMDRGLRVSDSLLPEAA